MTPEEKMRSKIVYDDEYYGSISPEDAIAVMKEYGKALKKECAKTYVEYTEDTFTADVSDLIENTPEPDMG